MTPAEITRMFVDGGKLPEQYESLARTMIGLGIKGYREQLQANITRLVDLLGLAPNDEEND